jgi:hypothetical protein
VNMVEIFYGGKKWDRLQLFWEWGREDKGE